MIMSCAGHFFVEACRKVHKHSSNQTIEEAIGRALKYASQRISRREEKKKII
jgi:hypothetical protein